ncbi:phosphoribosylanthranilate isomerase [Alicyclobacillus curvatus]|nr:phosphoribosylanthranilate isomerase [Alicyclobacillus curvatus]
MIHIKICGLQPGDDLSFTRYPEITHVGFILVKASRRYVRPADIASMARQVDPSCKKVGVYVGETLAAVVDSAHSAGLDIVQLHGNEDVHLCQQLKQAGFEVWKALPMPLGDNPTARLVNQIAEYASSVDAILVDAAPPKGADKTVTGGHGLQFDWGQLRILEELLQNRSPSELQPPIWVAGGIRPDNIADLAREFVPYGLDVSSGVEVKGRKSLNQIEAMREAVRRHADGAATR